MAVDFQSTKKPQNQEEPAGAGRGQSKTVINFCACCVIIMCGSTITLCLWHFEHMDPWGISRMQAKRPSDCPDTAKNTRLAIKMYEFDVFEMCQHMTLGPLFVAH